MATTPGVDAVLRCYPRIYFACHLRHVRDERTNRVLSASRAGILDHLDELEGMEVHRLAKRLGVTPSTMSVNLGRLEKAAYVVRGRDADDSRRVRVRLTKAGARVKQQQKVLDPDLVRAMLQQLSAKDQDRAVAGLELLAAAATRLLEGGASAK